MSVSHISEPYVSLPCQDLKFLICLTFLPSSFAIAFTVMVFPVPDWGEGGRWEEAEKREGEGVPRKGKKGRR
jgi:hypothetical protein